MRFILYTSIINLFPILRQDETRISCVGIRCQICFVLLDSLQFSVPTQLLHTSTNLCALCVLGAKGDMGFPGSPGILGDTGDMGMHGPSGPPGITLPGKQARS